MRCFQFFNILHPLGIVALLHYHGLHKIVMLYLDIQTASSTALRRDSLCIAMKINWPCFRQQLRAAYGACMYNCVPPNFSYNFHNFPKKGIVVLIIRFFSFFLFTGLQVNCGAKLRICLTKVANKL